MDPKFFKKIQEIANKPRNQYTKADELVKHEATLIVAAYDPFVRGATIIRAPGKTVEQAKIESYRHDVTEGWKKVTPQIADSVARGIEGIENEEKLNEKLQSFIKEINPEAIRRDYEVALAKLRKDLYHK
jgi:hypothetical protein